MGVGTSGTEKSIMCKCPPAEFYRQERDKILPRLVGAGQDLYRRATEKSIPHRPLTRIFHNSNNM